MKSAAVALGKKTFSNSLLSGSVIMFLGTNLANFFAYLYHFVIARLLGNSSYGELVAFISLLSLLSTTYSFFGLVIVKFTSSGQKDEVSGLVGWFSKVALWVGVTVSILFIIATPVLSRLLHMEIGLLLLVAPIFFLGLISFIYRSALQGLLAFFKSVTIANVELFGRLAIGSLLVTLGFGLHGAAWGILLASIATFLVSLFFIRKYVDGVMSSKKLKNRKKIFSYAFWVLVISIAGTSFFSTDVLFVKHFLPDLAGTYGAVATMGRIILYAAGPIGGVMFPIVSKRQARGQPVGKIFYLSLAMSLAVCVSILLVFVFLPKLVLLPYGRQYLDASLYLWRYGLFMLFLSLSSLLANFYMSLGKTWVTKVFFVAAVCQIVGMLLFHRSLVDILTVSLFASFGLFFILVTKIAYETKK